MKNNRVKDFSLITNKLDKWKIYDHVTKLYMSFFHVTMTKLSWQPMAKDI